MIRNDQGHFIYEQVFHRTEMVRAAEALAAASVERTKAGGPSAGDGFQVS
jgi:hypothetical protein